MVTARKATVLTPKAAPKPRKPKAAEVIQDWVPREGAPTWRSRPTRPNPFGDTEPSYYGTEEEVRARHQVDTEAGMQPVIETLGRGFWGLPPRPVVTVASLAKRGLAREHPGNGGTRWEISPEGQRLILESMKVSA